MKTFIERENDLLESASASVKQVLQIPFQMEEPNLYHAQSLHTEIGVLINFTGEMEGRLLIDGGTETFGALGASMFGMALEGEMLHSFVGELANMVAGNICSFISNKGWKVDITPPTILIGEMKWFDSVKVFSFPVAIQDVGQISIILLLQAEKVA
jgi:chemotaxis protein CheX